MLHILVLSDHVLNEFSARFHILEGVDHFIRLGRIDGTSGNDINFVIIELVQIGDHAHALHPCHSLARSSKLSEVGISAGNIVEDQVEGVFLLFRSF